MGTLSTTKFLKNLGGKLAEFAGLTTSAGAGDAGAVPILNAAGVLDPTIVNAKNASAGAGDAGKIVQLDASGKISSTMINSAGNANSKVMTTSEALTSGNWINIHDVGGNPRVRKADAATGKEAMGFVLESPGSGGTCTVYFEGENTGVIGMVAGPVYLSATPGAGQATSPTGAGVISQVIGVATSATSVNYQSGPVIVQAA
jgi:hypothetical protein